MTEEEAKTKICPRKLGHDISFGNQDQSCEASACMAWRQEIAVGLYAKDNGARIERGHIYLRGNAEERREVVGGFCGLAGAPQ